MKRKEFGKAQRLLFSELLHSALVKKNTIILVFDGHPTEGSHSIRNHSHLQVIFSGDVSADERIAELVHYYYRTLRRHSAQITVISDDGEVQSVSRRFDFKAESVASFLNMLYPERVSENPDDSEEKPNGITDDEMEEWIQIFNRKKNSSDIDQT